MTTGLSNLRVAVVDDDVTLLGMINEVLTEQGFVVTTFSDGQQLQRNPNAARFDLVLTDINMPEVSGIELFRYLRGIGSKAEVIVMTANAEVSSAIEAVRLGAFDYLRKPFEDVEDVAKLAMKAADKILSARRKDHLVQAVVDRMRQLVKLQSPGAEQTDLDGLLGRVESMVTGLQSSNAEEGKLTGTLEEIGFPNLVQMLALVGKSGVLQVNGADWQGELHFLNGRLAAAVVGRVTGEKALARLMGKQTGQFRFVLRDDLARPEEIHGSVDGVLIEALRRVDEMARWGRRIPPGDLMIRFKAKLPTVDPQDEEAKELILRYSRVEEILDYSSKPDLETAQSLIRLRLAGHLEIARGS